MPARLQVEKLSVSLGQSTVIVCILRGTSPPNMEKSLNLIGVGLISKEPNKKEDMSAAEY